MVARLKCKTSAIATDSKGIVHCIFVSEKCPKLTAKGCFGKDCIEET